MYIIDVVKLWNSLAKRSLDYREGGDSKTAEIFKRIEGAFISSVIDPSLESVIDERAREIVAKALESIIKYCDSRDHSDIHVTRYALEHAIMELKGESGQCTTPNDGPIASPVTAANDADPDAMRIVRLERIANTIIDYSEASCIDESDPEDPMAKIIRETREVMRRPAPSPRPIDCAECKIQPSFVKDKDETKGEKLHCDKCGKETMPSNRRAKLVSDWRVMNEASTSDAKAEAVKLNSCRVCGNSPLRTFSGLLRCANVLCRQNKLAVSDEYWNAANPLPSPVTPERQKLYHIQFDGQAFWIEAHDYSSAVSAWKEHVKVIWENDYDGTEEPESCALIHDDAVIRL